MIQKIGAAKLINAAGVFNKNNTVKSTVNYATSPAFTGNYNAVDIAKAYQGMYGIQTAKTVSFGQSLSEAFSELTTQMKTCTDERGEKGEDVGSQVNVTGIVKKFAKELPSEYDAIKTNINIDPKQSKTNPIIARTQIKKMPFDYIMYQMAVRPPEDAGTKRSDNLKQLISIFQRPAEDDTAAKNAYVLNTKGNLMAVIEDGDNVLLTNAGGIKTKAGRGHLYAHAMQRGNTFKPFKQPVMPETPIKTEAVSDIPVDPNNNGTEIVIGMEENRFVPEIIKSIEDFIEKIDKGEIVLGEFHPQEGAKNLQLAMLAGGFGSRAEYTNASSSGIMHGEKNGAQSTKGVFRTATGLTPMETTFVSLHNAGLLNCSKGQLKIGENIKFYLNKSGVNKGNGGFTVDLYNKMQRSGRKYLTIFPNDSMSRMTNATRRMFEIMEQGNTAIAMIAKEVKSEDAKGNFGIMKLGAGNEILEFKEKPKQIPEGYEKDGKCLTNTFQFAVSKEAFEALATIEPFFPAGKGKEPRDWSKTFIPILMALTQKDDINEIAKDITKVVGEVSNKSAFINAITSAKAILGSQKIVAVPTDEPWADCGTLNALYHTTMQIASGDFKLEDFERRHVLNSINTETGLIASTPEQKKYIEDNYSIQGEVMVVPKAVKVYPYVVSNYMKKGLITVNEKDK